MELDSRQRAHLKGLAHHLKPVVHVGKDGLSEALLKQIEGALIAHELIKVKLADSSPLDRAEASKELPEKSGAAFVQNVGKVIVLYRPHPEEPRIELPPSRIIGEDDEPGVGEDLSGGLPQSVRRRGPSAPAPSSAPASTERPPRRPAPRKKEAPRRRGASSRRDHKRGGGRTR